MTISSKAIIHPSAVIEDGAVIAEGCQVGPFCMVGPQVVLKAGVVLKSHVVVTGDTEVGEETVIFPFSVIGEIPQDLKFKGEASKLVIGKRNRIREAVTMNSGTEGGGGVTQVGDDICPTAATLIICYTCQAAALEITSWCSTVCLQHRCHK